jgi:curved DNA-binding protein
MKYKDYYKTLGIEKSADEKQIKAAFRKLARKYHPDVNKEPEAVSKFKEINEAYEVLSDPEKRKRYDSFGNNWQEGSNFTPPPGYENININFGQGGFGGFEGFGDIGGMGGLGGFSDFFSAFFGDMGVHSSQRHSQPRQQAHHRQPEENLDITQDLYIDLEDLMGDATKAVKISYMDKCPDCGGRGSMCYKCGGSGVTSVSKTLNVKIPKGVKENNKIRLTGEGKASASGRKGNLYFVIKYKKHPDFVMDGENITSTVKVPAPKAVLGTIAEVKTLQGIVKVTIPAGTQSGKSLRLKGLGLPKKEGGFGDHIAKTEITIPEEPTAKEKDLYKKLAELL